MNKYQVFLDYFDSLHLGQNLPKEVKEVLKIIKKQSLSEQEKPEITELGVQILKYMQDNSGGPLTANAIARGLDTSSRKINGAIRKLVIDKFVEKFGRDPVKYELNEKGKNYKEND